MQLITIMCLAIIRITYLMQQNWARKPKIQKKFNKKKNNEKILLKKDTVLALQSQNQLNNPINLKSYQQNHHKIKKVCPPKISCICWIKFNLLKMNKQELKVQ